VSDQQSHQPRPPQVTFACLIVMLGSVFVVLLMWDRVTNLNNLETQKALQDFLDHSEVKDAGLGLNELSTIVKVVSMALAACAVAMVVQGYQATKRSRGARLTLTVLSVPLFLLGLVGDGFVSSAAATFWCSGVVAAVLTLWLGPTRVWFGDPAPSGPHTAPRSAHPTQTPGSPPTGPSATRLPTRLPPPPTAPEAWTPPSTSAYDVRVRRATRPRALLWACLLTWVFTGLSGIGLVLSLAVITRDPDSLLDEMYRQNPELAEQGLTHQTTLAILWVVSVLVLVAAVAAAVFALLVFLGHRWAWYALLASAGVAALVFLVGALGSPVALVPVAASVGTIGCLVRPEVRAWFASRP
jgi:hypothetical protein